MDKRQNKRIKTRQIVKIGGKLGVVNDISDSGVQLSTAYSPQNRKINILIESAGKFIEITGIIQWIKKKQQVQALNEMGVVIKNAPPEYLYFVRHCQST
jgi:hypothetical protein